MDAKKQEVAEAQAIKGINSTARIRTPRNTFRRVSKVAGLLLLIILITVNSGFAAFLHQFYLKWGTPGSGDGQFNYPRGVAVDALQYVYVVDENNHRVQKFTFDGVFITKWGTQGSGQGQFLYPQGIAIGYEGPNIFVYVADQSNHRIQKFDYNGMFIREWGSNGAGDGQFNYPTAVAVDATGNVYVVDTNNNRIQKFTSAGTFIKKWGLPGILDGLFHSPWGIAVDPKSNAVFVSDTGNNRIQKFDANGTFLAKWGGYGGTDGRFNFPTALAVDEGGNLYVADSTNNRVQMFDTNGIFITKWGSWGSGDGQFNGIYGIAYSSPDQVYVSDFQNYRIQMFRRAVVVGEEPPQSSCPFVQNMDEQDDISTLRELRNSIITSPSGALLATLYYRDAGEISSIIAGNSALQEKFKQLVSENMGIAEALLAAGEVTITAEKVNAIVATLHEIQAAGSPKLQADINIVLWFIERGSLLEEIGITVGE